MSIAHWAVLRGGIMPLFTYMPAHFDTDAEDAKLKSLREREEEDLALVLADKNGIPYTDLSAIAVNADALRVIHKQWLSIRTENIYLLPSVVLKMTRLKIW
jgi:hypothetical protein